MPPRTGRTLKHFSPLSSDSIRKKQALCLFATPPPIYTNGVGPMSLLQNSGWMSGNPALRPLSGSKRRCPAVRQGCMFGIYLHGGSMARNSSSDKKAAGRLDARKGGAQALRGNAPNQMGRIKWAEAGKPIAAHEFCKRPPIHDTFQSVVSFHHPHQYSQSVVLHHKMESVSGSSSSLLRLGGEDL